jgi:LysM repeat protein
MYQQTAAAGGLILPTITPQANTTTTTPNSTLNLLTSIPPTGSAVTTTTTPFFVATVTPGRPANYTLKLGEFPYCIARRFNVNQNELLAANNLSLAQAGDLPVGTPLIIPQSAGPFIGTRYYHAHPSTFTVGTTDPKITTLSGVACYYGDIDPSVIAAANGLSLTSPLNIGRILTIP